MAQFDHPNVIRLEGVVTQSTAKINESVLHRFLHSQTCYGYLPLRMFEVAVSNLAV